MSNAQKYIAESLGSTGFAVLRGQIAFTQCPHLWATASDASYDFMEKNLNNRLGTVIGCQTYLARFKGVDGPLIKILARSTDQLAQRIEWVTGFKAILLIHENEMAGVLDQADVPARKVFMIGSVEGGDLYPDLVTAEPGKRCSECEFSTSGSGCTAFKESRIRYPNLNVPRRCIAYRPRYESADARLGVQLWPELTNMTK